MLSILKFGQTKFFFVSDERFELKNLDQQLLISAGGEQLLSLVRSKGQVVVNHCDENSVGAMINGQMLVMWQKYQLPEMVLVLVSTDMVRIFTDLGCPFEADFDLVDMGIAAQDDQDIDAALGCYQAGHIDRDLSYRAYAFYLLISAVLPLVKIPDNGDFA